VKRLPTWGQRLVTFAEAQVGQPTVWGTNDCHALVRGACEALYGVDLYADVPRWRSKGEALARLARGEDAVATLLARGATRLPSPQHAVLGDLLVEPGLPRTAVRPVWIVVGTLHLGAAADQRVVAYRRPPDVYPDGTVAVRLPE